MGIEHAKRTLKGMGKTIRQNTPGPNDLWQGFVQTHRPALPIFIAIAILMLFGEPFCAWLTRNDRPTADQRYGCTVEQQAPSGECK